MTSARPRGAVLVAHPSPDLYGSDRVLLESVSGIVATGRRVVVTLPTDGPLVRALEDRGAEVRLCPTLVLRKALLRPSGLPALVAGTVRGLVHGARLLRAVRPAVVYVNTLTIPLWPALARLARVPSVCHVHEAERSASRWVRRALAAPVALADVVLVNSRFSGSVLADALPRLARRTRLLPNGVPGPAAVSPPRAALAGGLRVGYVGRLSPRKGVDVAVEAVALLRERGVDATLDVVGAVFDGYEWFERQLVDQVADRGLAGRVRFHGFRDDVWGVLDGVDVLVVPSRLDEPFGNTAVEGLLAARPVVASATSGLLEATEGYAAARTAAPGDAVALADALASVAAEWPSLSVAVLDDAERAAERHDPARYRRRVADVVEEVAR